jgi:hypothetical protein
LREWHEDDVSGNGGSRDEARSHSRCWPNTGRFGQSIKKQWQTHKVPAIILEPELAA